MLCEQLPEHNGNVPEVVVRVLLQAAPVLVTERSRGVHARNPFLHRAVPSADARQGHVDHHGRWVGNHGVRLHEIVPKRLDIEGVDRPALVVGTVKRDPDDIHAQHAPEEQAALDADAVSGARADVATERRVSVRLDSERGDGQVPTVHRDEHEGGHGDVELHGCQ